MYPVEFIAYFFGKFAVPIEVVKRHQVVFVFDGERLQGAEGHFAGHIESILIDLRINPDFTPFPFNQPHAQYAGLKNRGHETTCRFQRFLSPTLHKSGQIKAGFKHRQQENRSLIVEHHDAAQVETVDTGFFQQGKEGRGDGRLREKPSKGCRRHAVQPRQVMAGKVTHGAVGLRCQRAMESHIWC